MVFDLHCDTFLRIYRDKTSLRKNNYHIDIEKMIQGQSTTQFFAMFLHKKTLKNPFETCNLMIDVFEAEIQKNPEIEQAFNYTDILDHRTKGKMSAIVTIEGGCGLMGSLENLDHLFKRGCRAITLTWNYENAIGYPNCIEPDKGLKPFGLEVIKAMNRLGIIIDVSHLSDAGFWDCIKHSNQPIVATHSNARGLCDHSRNLTDDMILALRDNGGIMGMNYCSLFLDGSKTSKVSEIIKHIQYIKDLAGIEVIALGSDFDGIGGDLEIANIGQMDKLVQGLTKSGFSQDEIDAICYKNADRVMAAVLK